MKLMEQTYCGESIVDIEADVMDAINDADIPDEHGIPLGSFKVTIEWVPEDV
jgi:hypothetical protein